VLRWFSAERLVKQVDEEVVREVIFSVDDGKTSKDAEELGSSSGQRKEVLSDGLQLHDQFFGLSYAARNLRRQQQIF